MHFCRRFLLPILSPESLEPFLYSAGRNEQNEQALPHFFTRLQSTAVNFHSAFKMVVFFIVSNSRNSNHSHSF